MPGSGPSKFTEARQELWLRLIAKGVSRSQAAKQCGVTVNAVIKHKHAHPEFLQREEEAEEEFCFAVENLYKKIMFKNENEKAIQWFLSNRNAKRWQQNKRPSVIVNNLTTKSQEDIEQQILSTLDDIQGKPTDSSKKESNPSGTISPSTKETEAGE